jgi:polar amino acid transport system substrate-binding protein
MNRRLWIGAAFALLATPLAVTAQAQTYKVGSTPTGIPFTFLDTKTNTIEGALVDLMKAVSKDAGFTAQIEPMQFSALIGALNSKRIDIISAAMYVTPVRQEQVAFTEPFYTYGEGLFVSKSDKTDYKTWEDLKGAAVGAQVGTAYVEPLKKSGLFSEVKIYDTIPDIMRDVNAGRIKAGFADKPIVGYNLTLGLFPEVRLAQNYVSTLKGSIAMGVRKDDPALLKKLNDTLAKLKANGTFKTIFSKFGLE